MKAAINYLLTTLCLFFISDRAFAMEQEAFNGTSELSERAQMGKDYREEFLQLAGAADPHKLLNECSLEDIVALIVIARTQQNERAQQINFLLRLELATKLRSPKNRALAIHYPPFFQKLALDEQTRAELAPLLLSNELSNFLKSYSYRSLILPEIATHPLLEGLAVIECQSFPRFVRSINHAKSCIALVEYRVLVQENAKVPEERTFYDLSFYNRESGKKEASLTGLEKGEVLSCVTSKSMTVFAVATVDQIVLWDMLTRKQIVSLKQPELIVKEVALSPEGNYLIVIGEAALIVYESATGKLLHRWYLDVGEKIKGTCNAVVKCAPGGKKLVVGTDKGNLYQWDFATGKLDFKMPVHTDLITMLHVDNDLIKSCGGDWKMRSVSRGRVVASLIGKEPRQEVQLTQKIGAAFSKSGNLLILAHNQQPGATLFDISNNKEHHIPLKYELAMCCFSPNDTFFAAASVAELFVAPLKQERSFFLNCPEQPRFISFSESNDDGTTVLAGFAKEVRFWPLFEKEFKEKLEKLTVEQLLFLVSVYEGFKKNQEYVIIKPSYAFLLFESLDEAIKQAVLSVSRIIKAPQSSVHDQVKLVRTDSAQNLIQNPFSYVSFSGELTPSLFGAIMKVIALEVTKGLPEWIQKRLEKTVHQLKGHEQTVTCLAYDGVGKKIASGSSDGSIKLWDLETGVCCRTIAAHDGVVFPLSFNAAGTQLVSSSCDGICVWHLATGERVAEYAITDSASVVFDRSGEFIFAGSYHGCITILHAGAVVDRFVAHKDAIWALNVDALGSRIVSSDNTGGLKVWQSQKQGVWKQPSLLYEGVLNKRIWHIAFDVDNISESILFAHHDEGVDCIDIVDDTYSRMDSPMALVSPWMVVAGKPESRCVWIGADNSVIVSELKDMRTWVEVNVQSGPCIIL